MAQLMAHFMEAPCSCAMQAKNSEIYDSFERQEVGVSRGLAPAASVGNMSTGQCPINFTPFFLFLEELVRAFAGQFRCKLNLRFLSEMRWADPSCKLVICNATRRRYWESVSCCLVLVLHMSCNAILFHISLKDRSERSPLSISSKLSHPKEAPGEEPQMSLQLKNLLMKISSIGPAL